MRAAKKSLFFKKWAASGTFSSSYSYRVVNGWLGESGGRLTACLWAAACGGGLILRLMAEPGLNIVLESLNLNYKSFLCNS